MSSSWCKFIIWMECKREMVYAGNSQNIYFNHVHPTPMYHFPCLFSFPQVFLGASESHMLKKPSPSSHISQALAPQKLLLRWHRCRQSSLLLRDQAILFNLSSYAIQRIVSIIPECQFF
eukprot:EG_transcript_5520